jgi:hypothetical protein
MRPLPPEPTFTLRARDEGAAEALITYARLAKDRGADAAHVAEIQAAAEAFRAFPVSVVPGREPADSRPGCSIPEEAVAHTAPAHSAEDDG